MVISTERNLKWFSVGVAHPLFCYAFGSFFAPLQPDRYLSVVLCVRRKDTIMKKAVMSINTGAKAIDIIKKYTDNVIIRVSDFYPDSVGGQEYCEITKPVFFELLKYKAMDEGIDPTTVDPDNTPTVIIRVKDFYPRSGKKEEYREISRNEFSRLLEEYKPFTDEIESDDKITVRTRDFAPYIDSDREYTDIDWKTYVTILRIKASEDFVVTPDTEKTATVKIKLRDFFPKVRLSREYNEVGLNIYEELLRMKERTDPEYVVPAGDKVKIKMNEFYPDYTGKEEFVEVSLAVYDYLMAEKLRAKRNDIQDYRYVSGCEFNEIMMAEINGIYAESAEEAVFKSDRERKLYAAIAGLPQTLRRRIYLYYFGELTLWEIARLDKVSASAVGQSLKTALKLLRGYMTEK